MKLSLDDYRISNAADLLTPCLLVYEQILRQNVEAAIRIAGSAARLRLHVKTHKTPAIVRLLISYGIHKHKCATLSEAMMLAECGAIDVLIAYPLVGPNVRGLLRLCETYPQTKFSCVVDSFAAIDELSSRWSVGGGGQAAKSVRLDLPVYLDLNTGMNRTGVLAGPAAIALYERLAAASGLRPAGLHVYDGQNHQPQVGDRQAAVDELMRAVVPLVETLTSAGLAVPQLVCGGTPTFPVFAKISPPRANIEIELSPGTSVLWDAGYGRDYADLADFRPAAVLLTRVISKTLPGHLTLDLGHKAIAADPPFGGRCYFLSPADARELKHSEEHLVIATEQAEEFEIGEEVYAFPTHICPTVALHSHLQVVRDGVVSEQWTVARDRLYRVNGDA